MQVTVDVEKRTIVGRAATYGVISSPVKDTPDGPVYKEVIAKGAFKKSLEINADILSFKEHDPKMILGRTSAGTLTVQEQDDGLYVAISIPQTTFGNDLLESVNRGDINGFSFGFKPTKSRVITVNGEKIIERQEVTLIEVSPTARPAYSGTEMALRSVINNDYNLEAQIQRHKFNEFISNSKQ